MVQISHTAVCFSLTKFVESWARGKELNTVTGGAKALGSDWNMNTQIPAAHSNSRKPCRKDSSDNKINSLPCQKNKNVIYFFPCSK